MTADEQQRLTRTLELTGLSEKQVEHILNDVRYLASQIEYRTRNSKGAEL